MTSGRLWNYYRVEVSADANEIVANHRINNSKTTSISFEYKTKILWKTPANNNRLNTEVVAPLKHLSNFGDLLIYV